MKAFLKNYRHAPRKVRLVTDAVKGKRVDVALTELSHANKKGADQIMKLISSAVANAKVADSKASPEGLVISNITVDQGMVMKRFMPRARGRAFPIHRESSHVRIELSKVDAPKEKAPKAAKVAATPEKPKAVRKPRAKKAE